MRDVLNTMGFTGMFERSKQGGSKSYLVKIVLLTTIVLSVFYVVRYFRDVQPYVSGFGQEVLRYYPEGLEISVSDGIFSLNQTQPYKIPFIGFFDNLRLDSDPVNMFVVDTSMVSSREYFTEQDSFVVVTGDKMMVKSSNNRPHQIAINKFQDSVLTKQNLQNFFAGERWTKMQGWLPFAYITVVILANLLRILSVFVITALLAMVVWSVMAIFKKEVSLSTLYYAIPYAMTFGLVVYVVLLLAGISSNIFIAPALATIILVLNFNKIVNSNDSVSLPHKYDNGFESSL